MRTKSHNSLFRVSLLLWMILSGIVACGAPPDPPLLSPAGSVSLKAGDTISMSATSENATSFQWNLQGIGQISSQTGTATIYTAPADRGGVAIVEVIAANANGESSPTALQISVATPPPAPPSNFTIESPSDGETIEANQSFGANGMYSGADDAAVWILLTDEFGNFYLQNPPVRLEADGKWVATNLTPNEGISGLVVVFVSDVGNEEFRSKVDAGDFAGFQELPEASVILGRVTLVVE